MNEMISMLSNVFEILVLVGGSFFTLIGLFTFWHIFRVQKSPADTSNRLNKFRLYWFAMTREELFTDVFPWLKNDEMDNVASSDDSETIKLLNAEVTKLVLDPNDPDPHKTIELALQDLILPYSSADIYVVKSKVKQHA